MANRNPAWTHKEISPAIQEAIKRLCERSRIADHEAIISELLTDPEATAVTRRAARRLGYGQRAIAGNMIAWLSQTHTTRPERLGEFSGQFKKYKTGHETYSYRRAR